MVHQKRAINYIDNINSVDDINIMPTIVDIDSAPAGVNFSDCALNSEGQCCVDFVSASKCISKQQFKNNFVFCR